MRRGGAALLACIRRVMVLPSKKIGPFEAFWQCRDLHRLLRARPPFGRTRGALAPRRAPPHIELEPHYATFTNTDAWGASFAPGARDKAFQVGPHAKEVAGHCAGGQSTYATLRAMVGEAKGRVKAIFARRRVWPQRWARSCPMPIGRRASRRTPWTVWGREPPIGDCEVALRRARRVVFARP